jgi:hypothetical protein
MPAAKNSTNIPFLPFLKTVHWTCSDRLTGLKVILSATKKIGKRETRGLISLSGFIGRTSTRSERGEEKERLIAGAEFQRKSNVSFAVQEFRRD